MDTTRWTCADGEFTISDSVGRLLIAIEPADAPDGDYYDIWEDGWSTAQLMLGEPLDWRDEHDNSGHIERLADGNVTVCVLPNAGQRARLGAYTPAVTLTAEQWDQAVSLLVPAVSAASGPADIEAIAATRRFHRVVADAGAALDEPNDTTYLDLARGVLRMADAALVLLEHGFGQEVIPTVAAAADGSERLGDLIAENNPDQFEDNISAGIDYGKPDDVARFWDDGLPRSGDLASLLSQLGRAIELCSVSIWRPGGDQLFAADNDFDAALYTWFQARNA